MGALIDAGADVNQLDAAGASPLGRAVIAGNCNTAATLIELGADVNLGIDGQSPLHLLANGGPYCMIDLLIEAGADIDARDDKGYTPLHAAAFYNNVSFVRRLLSESAKVDVRSERGLTPLRVACEHASADVVNVLVDAGASVNSRDATGREPIHVACYGVLQGDWKTVFSILLKRGASIDAEDAKGVTPLLLAIQGGHVSLVRYLVDAGANVIHVDANGNGPLHYAVDRPPDDKGLPIVEYVLSLSAVNVNQRNKEGQTALHVAASRGWSKAARLLLARGADRLAKDNSGHTPAEVARISGHEDLSGELR